MSTNLPPADSEALDDDPFEELASEFATRYRNGELPSIEEYARAHPDLADEIRELFPTIAAMERSKPRPAAPKIEREALPLEQLGDFRLLGEIGRGGMGIVYEAEQVSLGRHVAVKVLPKQSLLDESHLKRFEREAQTAAKLHHTNIVPVFGVGQQDGYHYIVMQFIPGVGLDEVLLALRQLVLSDEEMPTAGETQSIRATHASHNAKALLKGKFAELSATNLSGSFVRNDSKVVAPTAVAEPTNTQSKTVQFNVDSTGESGNARFEQSIEQEPQRLEKLGSQFYYSVAKIGQQVAEALAYAHDQGTLHRDIKPGNLLLDCSGTVWVADFGLAKLAEHENVSKTGDIVGTLSYIPPESFSGTTDSRGDIYSLGLSLFELLALRPAYYGRDRNQLVREIAEGKLPRLAKLNPHIPRDLETIVLKAIAHSPEDRYATAEAFAHDLDCFLNDLPITARRMSVAEQLTRWCRKNQLVAALSAAVLTLLIALTIVFGVTGHIAKTQRDEAKRLAKQAEEEKIKADDARQFAVDQQRKAERERQKARELATESTEAVVSVFSSFAPPRLPISTLTATSVRSAVPVVTQLENPSAVETDVGADTPESVELIAAPPIKQETATRLEFLLETYLSSLAAKAENFSDFAAIFADLTLRVGTLHKALGNTERAMEAFDKAILRYQSLASEADQVERLIGVAVCYNEKAELLDDKSKADELFQHVQQMLTKEIESGRLQNSPRAQYELARTLFLMSIQRTGVGEGTPGSGPPVRRPFGYIRKAGGNLRRAIELLEPLAESEANPEYGYLLARCYSTLGAVSPPDERQSLVEKAVIHLERLVELQPGVDDYKYELALAKQRESMATLNADERLELLKQAVALLDEVCGRNTDVFNYQIARSRALGQYIGDLDRRAVQLALSPDRSDQDASMIMREDLTEQALRALVNFATLRSRYTEAFVSRIPATYQIDATEILAKVDASSAVEYFRDSLAHDAPNLIRWRAELGLARCYLQTNDFTDLSFNEAFALLDKLSHELTQQVEAEIVTWRPGPQDFDDTFLLWCETTYLVQGSLLTRTEPLIDQKIQQRMQVIRGALHDGNVRDQDFRDTVVTFSKADLDFKLAEVFLRLDELEKSEALRLGAEASLENLMESLGPQHPMVRFAGMRLMAHYRGQGDVEATMALRDKLPMRPLGRGRGGPPPPRPPRPDGHGEAFGRPPERP